MVELEQLLESREENYYRTRKVSAASYLESWKAKQADRLVTNIIDPIRTSEKIENYNDDLPLQLQSEALKTYIDDLRKLQSQ